MMEKVLRRLKEDPCEFVSGEALSESLGVSRTAIWKYINELKNRGYPIASSPRKGYKLMGAGDILNRFEIADGLKTKTLGREIHYYNTVDSTNSVAKKLAHEGCIDGTVVVADIQTAGRGRMGREWASSGGKGIWMSVVLRPDIPPEDVQLMTLAASVAVVRAVEQVTGIQTGIKWPNDIILHGRKVCGILTEMNLEIERIHYLVLGIGMNVNHQEEDFPFELRDRATSLSMERMENNTADRDRSKKMTIRRSCLIQAVLEELERYYGLLCDRKAGEVLHDWKKHAITLDREVRVIYKEDEYTGVAVDIRDDGKLVVQCSDGTTREIASGEVSVRGILGYAPV